MNKQRFQLTISAILLVAAAFFWAGSGVKLSKTEAFTVPSACTTAGCFSEDWTAEEVLGLARCGQNTYGIAYDAAEFISGVMPRINATTTHIENGGNGLKSNYPDYGLVAQWNGPQSNPAPWNCRITTYSSSPIVTSWHVDGQVK